MYVNGAIFKSPSGQIIILQYLINGRFCILSAPEPSRNKGINCMNVITDPKVPGLWLYSEAMLPHRLQGYERVDGYLIID